VNVDHLIHMANQIGQFYSAMPDRATAAKDVATHLRRFWDPRMRAEFMDRIDAEGDGVLEPLVAEAVRTHRALILSGVQHSKEA
jgi:formate dehydrogenase subunit delta